MEVFCSSADYTQSSTQCKNLGGSEVLDQANYASRRVIVALEALPRLNSSNLFSKNCKLSTEVTFESRLRMDVSASHCGIRIDRAHPYDTGEWKCHVTEVPGGSTLYSSVDLYVSNHSQVYISEPDMWEDSSQARISFHTIQKWAKGRTLGCVNCHLLRERKKGRDSRNPGPTFSPSPAC